MGLDAGFDGDEVSAKELEDLLSGVALDGQSGALRWPVGGEGGDDRVATRRQRGMQGFCVRPSVGQINEKVQASAVVPNGVAAGRLPGEQVGGHPRNLVGVSTESAAS